MFHQPEGEYSNRQLHEYKWHITEEQIDIGGVCDGRCEEARYHSYDDPTEDCEYIDYTEVYILISSSASLGIMLAFIITSIVGVSAISSTSAVDIPASSCVIGLFVVDRGKLCRARTT